MTESAEPPTREPIDPAPRAGRILLVARIAVPLALVVVGYAVLASERWTIDHELQIVAPLAARPGDAIPLRAFVFAGIDRDEGGALVTPRVEVELSRDGVALARTLLEPSATSTEEGAIALPPDVPLGELVLRALARDEAGVVVATVERALTLAREVPPATLSGRLAGELQHLRPGPVIVDMPGVVAPVIEARVAGGTCVPEERCELFVDAPDIDAITIAPTPAATVAESAREGRVHRLVLVVHGPEAAIELLLARAGATIAHVQLQLPVALATAWLDAPRTSSREIALEAHPPPGREAMILDAYVAGRWALTTTLRAGPSSLTAPGDGLVRLQVHADPFGIDYAIARHVLVGVPIERSRALLAEEGVVSSDPPQLAPELVLAGAEEELRALPAAVSGLEADRGRVAARRQRLQVLGATALGIGILVFSLTLLRRGLFAAAEARGVMLEAGDATATSRATRLRMTLAVLAMVGAVAVALLAGAALILARSALGVL